MTKFCPKNLRETHSRYQLADLVNVATVRPKITCVSTIMPNKIGLVVRMFLKFFVTFLYPATQNVTGYYVIPSKPSVRPYVRLSVRPSSFLPSVRPSAIRFRALILVFFDRFSSNFALALISGRNGTELQMGSFCLKQIELWQLMYVKLCFSPTYSEYMDEFREKVVYALIYLRSRFGQLHFIFH